MRVSPVGLYVDSLEETLELANISASVSHNHPEGIKGAQAIAACIYMKKNAENERRNKTIYPTTIWYDLNKDLRECRAKYTFDSTCQGSVPIAIMAFL